MKKFLVLLLCLASISAEAKMRLKVNPEGGSHTGGGGGGVFCQKDDQQNLTTLDFYETALKYGTQPEDELQRQEQRRNISLFDDMSREEVLSQVKKALTPLPELQRIVSVYLEKVGNPDRDWQDTKLEEYNDSGRRYVLDKKCKYVQLAVRQDDIIWADLELFNKMSPGHQAILILHEAIYYAAKERFSALNDSVVVRNIISKIIGFMIFSEFKIDPPARDLTRDQLESFGVETKYFNHFELWNLCKIAEMVNLCHVEASDDSEYAFNYLKKMLNGVYDDHVNALKTSNEKLKPVSKGIKAVYPSAAMAKSQYANYKKDLEMSKVRYMTVPALLNRLTEEVAVLEDTICSVSNPDAFFDQSEYSSGMSRVCRIMYNNIKSTLERIKTGYKREFCFRVGQETRCPFSLSIPRIQLTEENNDFLPVDLMDIRLSVLLEERLKKLEPKY